MVKSVRPRFCGSAMVSIASFAGDFLAVQVTAGVGLDVHALQVGLGRAGGVADGKPAVVDAGAFQEHR